ncbi:putative E3 ubiquitin-protein ligase ARI12 [Cardamine amara subsp. amara]|uniref:RBR-type E3 ubiquitin transferase n=1 Tax=Cardamine amara subsp. amara TaxID=228776 RepID=A0ABD1A0E0_CARAN
MDHSEVNKRLDKLAIGSVQSNDVDVIEEDDQTEDTPVQRSYATILTEEDIQVRMESDIQRLSDRTSLSIAEATLLLSHYSWDFKESKNKWRDDAKSVRECVGLLELDSPSDDKEAFVCGVCIKSQPPENIASVSCGHRICTYCWTSHINKIINEKPAAQWFIWLKCPASCSASIGRDMIESFASDEEKSKYYQYLLRSYVDHRETMKWYPAGGSCCAIDLTPYSGNSDVSCLHLLRFCWNCREEAHSPLDCKTAAKWVFENTVPCPQCKRRIEENQNCSLKMKCLPCNYDFCWHCHGDWTEHGEGTGGDLYTCKSDAASSDQLWNMAESAAARYREYYGNWDSYESLINIAKAKLQKLDTDIQTLSNTQLENVSQLKFILEAELQIIECTRVLKWTSAYGYYLREDDKLEKLNFLTQTQVDAMILLDKLEDCLKTLPLFVNPKRLPENNFKDFRNTLTDLTSITRKHYEELVKDLENGLAHVVSAASIRSQIAYNGEASGSGSNHDD